MNALRQRMLEDMQIRNFAPATQYAYVQAAAAFSRYFGRRRPQAIPIGCAEVSFNQFFRQCRIEARPTVAHRLRKTPHTPLR